MGTSGEFSVFPMFNFEEGLNTRFSLHALLQNEVAGIQNFHLEARGGVEKRAGYHKYITADTASGNEITGLWQHRSVDGDKVVKVENAAIFWDNAGTWTDITNAEVISADQDKLVKAEIFKKTSIFTDGVNNLLKWTGSGNVVKALQSFDATGDTIEGAYTLTRHRERIVLGDPNTLESASPISDIRASAWYRKEVLFNICKSIFEN